jgi:hypothetical protein
MSNELIMYRTEQEINDAHRLMELMDAVISDEYKRKYRDAFRTLGHAIQEIEVVPDTKPIEADLILTKVMTKYYERSEMGIKKYGTTLENNSLPLMEWLNHLQEELMDATLYIEKLKQEI